MTRIKRSRARIVATAVVATAVVGGLLLSSAAPSGAALSNVSLVASNNQVDSTGVTLTITFQVGALDKGIAVILPAGVSGLNVNNVSVQTSTDGTTFGAATLAAVNPKLISADTQRVGLNLASALALGNWAKVTITGLTNPGAAGDYTIQIGGKLTDLTQVDLDAVLATLLGLLAETANAILGIVAVITNGVSTDVSVAPALAFAASAASHSWSLDPAGTATSNSVSDSLTISSNAATYAIQGKISGNLLRVGTPGTSASDNIPINGAASDPHFGYKVTGPAGDPVDSTLFRTFSTSFGSLVGGWSLSGLTNSEVTTVTYDVKVDYTKSPGNYLATITYRIVPTY